ASDVWEDTDVVPVIALIGETRYASVGEAITAVKAGEVVKLNANATVETLTTDKAMSLDLNGKTLTVTGTLTVSAGKLTVYGGTLTATVSVTQGATLEITGGTYSFDPKAYLNTDAYGATESQGVYTVVAITTLFTEVPAKEATATASGNAKYYACAYNGKYYLDAEGKTETTLTAVTTYLYTATVNGGFKYTPATALADGTKITFANSTISVEAIVADGKISASLIKGEYTLSCEGYQSTATATVVDTAVDGGKIDFVKNAVKSIAETLTDYGTATENADGSYTLVTTLETKSADQPKEELYASTNKVTFNVDTVNSKTVAFEFDFKQAGWPQIYYGSIITFKLQGGNVQTNSSDSSLNYTSGNEAIVSFDKTVKHHFVFILDVASKSTRIFIDGIEGTYKKGVHVSVADITELAMGMALWNGSTTSFENIYVYDGANAEAFATNYLNGAIDYTVNGETKKTDGTEVKLDHVTLTVSGCRKEGFVITSTIEEGYKYSALKLNGETITLDDQDKYTISASAFNGNIALEIATLEIVEEKTLTATVNVGFKYASGLAVGKTVSLKGSKGTEYSGTVGTDGKLVISVDSGDTYTLTIDDGITYTSTDNVIAVGAEDTTATVTFVKNAVSAVADTLYNYGTATENADGSYTLVTTLATKSADQPKDELYASTNKVTFSVDAANSTYVAFEFDFKQAGWPQIMYGNTTVFKLQNNAVNTNGSGTSSNYPNGTQAIASFEKGVKHHFVFILDVATRTTRIFIDGVEGAYKNGAHVANATCTGLSMGMALW
ncbi:MAG: hypothetical protein MJ072_01665, partial [Clostridia bacterium]|nr:hypothetical protein [Clostridia bacterium]